MINKDIIVIKARHNDELVEILSYLRTIGYYDARSFAKGYPDFLYVLLKRYFTSEGEYQGSSICTRSTRETACRDMSAPSHVFFPTLRAFYTSNHNVDARGASMVKLFV